MPERPESFTCLCSVCCEDFGSTSAFDAHFTGKIAYSYREGLAMDPPREDGLRCLDPEEMRAKKMHKDSRGRWRRGDQGSSPFGDSGELAEDARDLAQDSLWTAHRGSAA